MIKVLAKEVYDKIAAGEVIESPVSIVKELIENSIDAGANSISCEIIKGGKDEIRVTDNGTGIPADQIETAFLRHATSKITKVEDLRNLVSLGFRGEALASIAAVSRTEVITRTEDEKIGTRIVLHGSEIISKEGIGCPVGTTFIVRDLFYNIPARSKFLKSEAAEAGKVIDMLSRLAITRPDIRFTLVSNGKNYFTSPGNGDLKAAIMAVYKDRDYKELLSVDYSQKDNSNSDIRVYGYISRPSFSRTNRRSQFFFVNGRTVKSKVLEKGVDLGYKERLFEGRFPICFLFIESDPSKLDVNVHPNKREVRFNDDIAVISAVEEAIRRTITTEESVIKGSDTNYGKYSHEPKSEKSEQVNIKEFLSQRRISDDLAAEDKEYVYNSPVSKAISESSTEIANDISLGTPDLEPKGYIPFDFSDLEFGGTIFGTYITATDTDNFYLFDQHACHERINYERFVGAYLSSAKDSQILLVPYTFDIPLEISEDEEWIEILDRMGYKVELFGENTYIVREIPNFMSLGESEEFLGIFIDTYNEDRKTENQVVIDKLITKSCKASIKANDYIKDEEILALIGDLKACRNPFSCPHGRPTFIKITKYEIEKMFKRIQ